MRFIFYLLLFFIAYYVIKLVIKGLSSPKTAKHNPRVNSKQNNYENVEDAKYTEIKQDEEKKNNS